MEYFLGLDIGGTKCAVSVGKWNYERIKIVERFDVKTQNEPTATFDLLSPYMTKWIKIYCVTLAGISCGGPLDSENGVIISTPNLSVKWHRFRIVDYVKARFGIDSRLENDANACAVAEWKFGAGKGSSNMIFLTFGTGFGAGLILNGRLYSGTNDNAGEIGHVRLTKSGPLGYYKKGSCEGYCCHQKASHGHCGADRIFLC